MRLKSKYDVPYGHKERLLTVAISGMRSSDPVIQRQVCCRCGTCYLYCPTGAIEFDEGGYKINLNFCKGCGICVKECPSNAIFMEL